MDTLKITLTTFMKFCVKGPRGKIGDIRKFLSPGGYDFYKAMKRVATKLARNQIDLVGAKAEINNAMTTTVETTRIIS